jgi:hypothetical protein
MKKELIKLIEKYSYGRFRNGEIGQEFDEYPDYLATVILDHFKLEKITLAVRKKKK